MTSSHMVRPVRWEKPVTHMTDRNSAVWAVMADRAGRALPKKPWHLNVHITKS